MHGLRGKGGQAYGEIVGSLRRGRAVFDPFASTATDRLPGVQIKNPVAMGDTQRAGEDEGKFIKLRRLSRFHPVARAAHSRDTQARFAVVQATDEFLDDFRFVSRRGDERWCCDELWHGFFIVRFCEPGLVVFQKGTH